MRAYDEITIVVPGLITAWKRVRTNRETEGHFTDPNVESYQSGVRREAKIVMDGDPPLAGPLELSYLAVFPTLKTFSEKKRKAALAGMVFKTTRPDIENLFKGILDTLQGIVYYDDAQIIGLGRCYKIYGERPRIELRFTVVDRVPLALPEVPAFKQPDLFAGVA